MAMISCPHCGSAVSEYAGTCPNCGFSLEKHARERKAGRRTVILVIVGAILIISGIVTGMIYIDSIGKNPKKNAGSPSTTVTADSADMILIRAKALAAASPLSKTEVIHKLLQEGCSAQTLYAVLQSGGIDWNEQAARRAQSLARTSGVLASREFVRKMLITCGFTEEEAEYGAAQAFPES